MGVTDHFNPNVVTVHDPHARCARPKGLPPILEREEKRQTKKQNDETFRAAIWKRDKGICRATGKPLKRSGTSPHEIGEIDHVLDRSTNPDKVYDVENGILISKFLNRLKKTACPQAPEHHMFEISGPADRGKPQKFTWRSKDGKVVKETRG